MGTIVVAEDYFKTLGMTMQKGREFTKPSDTVNVIFNETAIKRLRIAEPISKVITWNERQYQIVGVVNDALMLSPFTSADPTMFLYEPCSQQGNFIYTLRTRKKTHR